MTDYYVAAAFGLNALMAWVYALVGRAVHGRPVGPEARIARDSFAWWWYLLAIITAIAALATGVTALQLWTLDALVVFTQALLVTIMVALAALLYYFLYLLTGKRGAWKPIAAAYGLYTLAVLWYIQVAHPVAIAYGTWGASLEYANDLSDSPAATALGLLLLAPVLLGALGYFGLFFRVHDRSQRFRIATLAGAFIFWFGSSIVASYVLNITDNAWWRLLSNGIALLASYVVYIGYRPPVWLQRRYHLHGYDAALAADATAAEAK